MNIFIKFKINLLFIIFVIVFLYFNRNIQSKGNEKITNTTFTKNQIYTKDKKHKTLLYINNIIDFENKQLCCEILKTNIIKECYLVENNIKKFNDIRITK